MAFQAGVESVIGPPPEITIEQPMSAEYGRKWSGFPLFLWDRADVARDRSSDLERAAGPNAIARPSVQQRCVNLGSECRDLGSHKPSGRAFIAARRSSEQVIGASVHRNMARLLIA
jgi:hypothetical protein